MDSARHVITRNVNPHLLSQMASYDVAGTVHQSLPWGPHASSCAWRPASPAPWAAAEWAGDYTRPLPSPTLAVFVTDRLTPRSVSSHKKCLRRAVNMDECKPLLLGGRAVGRAISVMSMAVVA